MANTAIIDLAKPAGTDHALISVINSNMDKIDAEAGRQRGNFAGTYSTTSGYAVGDYCIYQGNLYRCTTAIGSSGENWTAAHWTQTKAGTELKGLSDHIATKDVTSSLTFNYTHTRNKAVKSGNTMTVYVEVPSGNYTSPTVLVLLPSGYRPSTTVIGILIDGSNNYVGCLYITSGGNNISAYFPTALTGKAFFGSVTYIV